MANEIVTEIRLELDKFRADLKDAQNAAVKSGKDAGQGMGDSIESGLSKAFGGLATKFLAIGSVIASAFTFKEAISAASEQETAINALNSALALSGNYTAQASKDFQDFAASLQKTTTAADEVIIQGGAMLATLGQLSGDNLKRATQASLDLAAALQIDQATAFNLVSKAATGHVSALSKYGLEVKATGDNARDFANVLTLVEGKFKGLSQLQTNTFAGALAQTKNQFGEILESLGNIVIQSPTVITTLKLLAKEFAFIANQITKFASNRDLIKEASLALVEFGHNLVAFVIAPLELAYNTGVLIFDGLKLLIQGAMVGIADSVSVVTSVLAPLGGKFAEINDAVKSFSTDSHAVLDQFTSDAANSAGKIFDFDASAKADEFLVRAQGFFATITPPVQAGFQAISDSTKKLNPEFFTLFAESFKNNAKSMETVAKDLGKQINATFVTGLGNAFTAMGQALAKGQNGMEAFGKAILGVLGDIVIQFGAAFIGLGIGRVLLGDPTGIALIAAGAALSVLGGALKALAGGAGGVGGATPAAGTGGGVASSGGSSVSPVTDQGQVQNEVSQRGEVGTRINVNIQGNVMDRRETGLAIADVINETFGSNGVTFATGAT